MWLEPNKACCDVMWPLTDIFQDASLFWQIFPGFPGRVVWFPGGFIQGQQGALLLHTLLFVCADSEKHIHILFIFLWFLCIIRNVIFCLRWDADKLNFASFLMGQGWWTLMNLNLWWTLQLLRFSVSLRRSLRVCWEELRPIWSIRRGSSDDRSLKTWNPFLSLSSRSG